MAAGGLLGIQTIVENYALKLCIGHYEHHGDPMVFLGNSSACNYLCDDSVNGLTMSCRLAHKLDARRLLAGLEDQILKSSGNVLGGFRKQLLWIPFVCSEQPLSSFRSAILLSLSKSFALRLMRGIGSLEKARDFVTMPAWEDIDKQTILMFVEALFFWMLREPIVLGDGREVLPFESWNAPGELIKKHLQMLLGSHDADPSIGEEGHGRGVNPHLDELVRLQQVQLEEDWEGEFDEYGSGPEVY